MTLRIALTAGEPAGIGPDLALALAQHPSPGREVVTIADPELLRERAQQLGLAVDIHEFEPEAAPAPQAAGVLKVLPREEQ